MFSVLGSRAGAGILLKYTRISELSTTFIFCNCNRKKNDEPSQTESFKQVTQSRQSHPLYKRDLINFPRPQRLETNPPVRFGLIPKEWFDFFYKKTGVTGGYMLLFGATVALFSKEIIVINPETCQALAFIILMVLIQKLYGQTIYNYIEKNLEESEEEIDAIQNKAELDLRNHIKEIQKALWCNEGVATFLPEAKRENVYLQMEIEYRERLKAQYMAVKNILDFQVAKSDIERLAFQKGLFSWIMSNVNQSITPEIKHNALMKSIEDLKDLASRNTI